MYILLDLFFFFLKFISSAILFLFLFLFVQAVAQWLNSLNRGTKRDKDSALGVSANNHHAIPRSSLPPSSNNNNGRPPRKDANEMSISMESSRSSLAAQQAQLAAHNTSQNTSGHSEDMLGISRELSRDRMQLSNNPFTSSGSFNCSSTSFSGTSSLTSSSGGVAAAHHHPGHLSLNAASRMRMAQDIGRGSVPEGDEYAGEKFEDEEDEEVHRYDDSGYSGYDYKQEEKKSSGNYYYERDAK